MDDKQWLAERFEAHRTHLRRVAYRMLGSVSEADNAVQEAWIRLSRCDQEEIENLGGWLTTVVVRVSLNMLRSRKSPPRAAPRRPARARADRQPQGRPRPGARGAARRLGRARAAHCARHAGSRGAARVRAARHVRRAVRRDRADRRALADGSAAARQQGPAPRARRSAGADAFSAAARDGDFDARVAVLDPDVVLRSDGGRCGQARPPWSTARGPWPSGR